MNPLTLYLDKIVFSGPGAENWEALTGLLKDNTGWFPVTKWDTIPECLTKRAARRVSPQIRLALRLAEQLAPHLDCRAGWIFGSSFGESETLHAILESLRSPEMMIQPLRFQNSVHNAAAGHWSIAARRTGPMTSIAAFDKTVGASLLKAGAQVAFENRDVGVVLYDVPLPKPLDSQFSIDVPLGAGLAFTVAKRASTLASLKLSVCESIETEPRKAVSQSICSTRNPVAAAMHLIEVLCDSKPERVVLGLPGGNTLCLDVTPK